jgi:hypothetical protein
VPRGELACCRVRDDGDVMTVQLGRVILRLLSGPAAYTGCQLVCLHGAGNRSSTRRGEDVCVWGLRRASWPTPQSEAETCCARRRLVVRGGDCSEEVPLAGNWSEMLPNSREQNNLLVMV